MTTLVQTPSLKAEFRSVLQLFKSAPSRATCSYQTFLQLARWDHYYHNLTFPVILSSIATDSQISWLHIAFDFFNHCRLWFDMLSPYTQVSQTTAPSSFLTHNECHAQSQYHALSHDLCSKHRALNRRLLLGSILNHCLLYSSLV